MREQPLIGHYVSSHSNELSLEGVVLVLLHASSRINTSDQPLSGCFFITRGTIDLSSKVKIPADLCFERKMELRWEGKVIFYGIGWPKDLSSLTADDCLDNFKLYLEWQRRGKSIHINLIGGNSFRFQEDLVALLLRELNDLIFN